MYVCMFVYMYSVYVINCSLGLLQSEIAKAYRRKARQYHPDKYKVRTNSDRYVYLHAQEKESSPSSGSRFAFISAIIMFQFGTHCQSLSSAHAHCKNLHNVSCMWDQWDHAYELVNMVSSWSWLGIIVICVCTYVRTYM